MDAPLQHRAKRLGQRPDLLLRAGARRTTAHGAGGSGPHGRRGACHRGRQRRLAEVQAPAVRGRPRQSRRGLQRPAEARGPQRPAARVAAALHQHLERGPGVALGLPVPRVQADGPGSAGPLDQVGHRLGERLVAEGKLQQEERAVGGHLPAAQAPARLRHLGEVDRGGDVLQAWALQVGHLGAVRGQLGPGVHGVDPLEVGMRQRLPHQRLSVRAVVHRHHEAVVEEQAGLVHELGLARPHDQLQVLYSHGRARPVVHRRHAVPHRRRDRQALRVALPPAAQLLAPRGAEAEEHLLRVDAARQRGTTNQE
mmetsp:Transcript_93784/g.244352  ORF Transcript_93784/g.244352 Transcript_93784/m.244352 type:complete len:311 (+) Transcript_93784:489-1421(+)